MCTTGIKNNLRTSGFALVLSVAMSGSAFAQVLTGTQLDITDATPEIRFLDAGPSGDASWEIEGNGNFFEISLDGSTNTTGFFKIHKDAATDALTLNEDGGVTILGETESDSGNSLEVFGKRNEFDFVGIAATAKVDNFTENGPSVRLQAQETALIDIWESGISVRHDRFSSYTLPLAIANQAPDYSFNIESSGDINIGDRLDNPGSLTISRPGTASIVMESGKADTLSDGIAQWEIKTNAGTGRMTFKNLLSPNGAPLKFEPNAVSNLLRIGVIAEDVVDINGDLVVTGNCSEQNGACADYVFESDYELRTLNELQDFIAENKHLPNVPSASDMQERGVNMAHITGRLLEKIEELTLYTLQQEKVLNSHAEVISQQAELLSRQSAQLDRLEAQVK